MAALRHYRQVWAIDFEFCAAPGERPAPLCVVARELCTGKLVRRWLADGAADAPPYPTGPDSLFIAYYASAELGCHLALDWPMPARVLDLYAEFRNRMSGLPVPCGFSLLGALANFGLDAFDAAEKEAMRSLALRGGPYSNAEREGLLDYCQSDVDALTRLLPAMLSGIDLPRALLRGRYMAAAARIEWAGVPLDAELLDRVRTHWTRIKHRIIAAVDSSYGVFVPADRRPINPQSTLGEALLETARDWNINPHDLADAVETVWQEERDSLADIIDARKAARKATGLTPRRLASWEDAGGDHASYPGIDVTARELAGMCPTLGIGEGYSSGDGYDGTNHAALLWDVLRDDDPRIKPRHDPDFLRRAADMVARAGNAPPHFGLLTFSTVRFAEYLTRAGIPWPRLESGSLALDEDTFKEMARAYPVAIGPLRDVLRLHRGELKRIELTVGADGRNRYLLSAFSSKTGRNQPSSSKSIFGPSAWLRSLIRPGPGRAIAYVDWSAQELAIAAAFSGDRAMQDAYRSGDPYLFFAKKAGAVPVDATKKTHPLERDQFKVVMLGVLYGLSADGIARKLCVPPCWGRELLQLHRETFRRFWAWSDQVQDEAMLTGKLQTVFGWRVHVGPDANPRSLRNFPMQGNGAEMLRLACCLTTERGINVCAPIHDALLVESPIANIEAIVARTQEAMKEAGAIVLDGFELRTDAKIVRYPDRYSDDRGRAFFERVVELLDTLDGAHTCAMDGTPTCATDGTGAALPVVHPPILISCSSLSNPYAPEQPR
jgi:hypothetical protein